MENEFEFYDIPRIIIKTTNNFFQIQIWPINKPRKFTPVFLFFGRFFVTFSATVSKKWFWEKLAWIGSQGLQPQLLTTFKGT